VHQSAYSPAYGSADPAFISLARSWMQNPAQQLLSFIWLAYENMNPATPTVDGRDLERSITQLLEPRVRDSMSGDEPYYIQHGPFERETMKTPPAQPPQYDLAFVLRADERIMWPLEAKVLETSQSVAAYVHDIQNEFLACRYAPFSSSGAMLGYLLKGSPDDAFTAIAAKLGSALELVAEHASKPNRRSLHQRVVPIGRSYSIDFACYHLILEYPYLSRTSKS
jgi:hypothetical protein